MHFNPTADTRIDAGDRLVLMGPVDNLREIERGAGLSGELEVAGLHGFRIIDVHAAGS